MISVIRHVKIVTPSSHSSANSEGNRNKTGTLRRKITTIREGHARDLSTPSTGGVHPIKLSDTLQHQTPIGGVKEF